MQALKLFNSFIKSEKTGGILLICCTLISLFIANSGLGHSYHQFWQTTIASESLEHWINDGLMTIFFLLIGLELEREIYKGELANVKDALFPIFGAIGGMLLPAGIYLVINWGTATQSGVGIPMATDIAFALGILSLLGKRVPTSLKVFLVALAIIDDLGAILIIAFFYTETLIFTNLFIALGIFCLLIILNVLRVKYLLIYLIGGVFMWYFMLHSGVHATITGVLLAFAIPFKGKGEASSPSLVLEHFLQNPVAFIILPIFALANTAIPINGSIGDVLVESYSLGIAAGLILGKPLGIFTFTFLSTKLKLCSLPSDLDWSKIISVGLLAGIGFTMSIFITLLAFKDGTVINNAKFIILLSSSVAGIGGFLCLKIRLRQKALSKT